MKLLKPLRAETNRVKAYIYINDKNFKVDVYFKDHQNTHTFDDEYKMFSYLSNIGLEPEQFNLSPF